MGGWTNTSSFPFSFLSSLLRRAGLHAMGYVGGGGGDRPLPPRKDGWEIVTHWTTCTPFSREKSAFGVTLLNLALGRLTTWLEAAATVGIVSRGVLLLRQRRDRDVPNPLNDVSFSRCLESCIPLCQRKQELCRSLGRKEQACLIVVFIIALTYSKGKSLQRQKS